jgi:hypothetical protein
MKWRACCESLDTPQPQRHEHHQCQCLVAGTTSCSSFDCDRRREDKGRAMQGRQHAMLNVPRRGLAPAVGRNSNTTTKDNSVSKRTMP